MADDVASSKPERTPSTVETTGAIATPVPVTPAELAEAATLPATATSNRLVGQRVGRFTITELLGAGGMGEVYAARDPELERMVAIKLLRPEISSERANARLHREARAMAKLSHPNLVTVYDVGWHQGQLFVAMELVSGETLRTWARDKAPREIIDAYVAAGRGLAAAHEAGIIHRDFKPDNVLCGADGRIAVGDFGLARSSEDDDGNERASVGDTLVTRVGALVGTLRYMAPEQLERRNADECSDQFAFCVSLWEALDGDPFGGIAASDDTAEDAARRRHAIAGGAPRRRLRGVPARISRALARGLVADPTGRWPSMTALLARIDPVRRRGRAAAAVAAIGLAGIAAATAWRVREPAADPCTPLGAAVDRAWNPSDRVRLATAFAATGRPGATELAERTATILDTRTAAWKAMKVESCRATVSGAQSDDVARRRSRCFEVRLAELDGLTGALLERPTPEMVDMAVRAANGLASVAECGNVATLLERVPQPSDALVRGRASALDAAIARAAAREALGTKDIATQLGRLEQQAIALAWYPAIAAVQVAIGHDLWRRGESSRAVDKLRDAALAASRAKDDELAAHALTLEIEALVDSDRAADALEVARAAELALARADEPPLLVADELSSLAFAQGELSKFDDADRSFARAAALLENSDQVALARTLQNWSNQLFERSDYTRGLELSNRVVAMMPTLVGEHHPDYARVLSANGNLLEAIGRPTEAKSRMEQALAIKQEVYGADEPTVASTVHSLGNVYLALGDVVRAREYYERAYTIYANKLGADHSLALMARYSLAKSLRRDGRPREALAMLEDVLARREAAKTPQPEKIANTLDLIGGVYQDLGDTARAIEYAQRALAIREKVLGPNTGDVAESLMNLALYWADAGNCTKAVPAAERALEILTLQPDIDKQEAGPPTLALGICAMRRHRGDEAAVAFHRVVDVLADTKLYKDVRGRARLSLAELTWRQDHDGARLLATQAVADLASSPGAAQAKAWLDQHER